VQPIKGSIKLFRKHCTTGVVSQVEGSYEIALHQPISDVPGWTVFRLVGGPTGYESFALVDDEGPYISTINSVLNSPYWSACAGTTDRRDECRVHRNEMRRVLIPWIEGANLEGSCHKCGEPGMLAEDPQLLKVAERLDYNFWCAPHHSARDQETQSVSV